MKYLWLALLPFVSGCADVPVLRNYHRKNMVSYADAQRMGHPECNGQDVEVCKALILAGVQHSQEESPQKR